MFDLSGGICAVFSHVPLAYLSKSSPGFTDLSMSASAMPDWVPAACACPWFLVLVLHALSARAETKIRSSGLFMTATLSQGLNAFLEASALQRRKQRLVERHGFSTNG